MTIERHCQNPPGLHKNVARTWLIDSRTGRRIFRDDRSSSAITNPISSLVIFRFLPCVFILSVPSTYRLRYRTKRNPSRKKKITIRKVSRSFNSNESATTTTIVEKNWKRDDGCTFHKYNYTYSYKVMNPLAFDIRHSSKDITSEDNKWIIYLKFESLQ